MAQKPFVLPSGVDFYAGDGTAAGAADPLLVVSDSANKVGINSQTPTGTLDINTASASDRGLIVRGATSQSSSLVEVQGSSGNTLAYVGPSGIIGGSGVNINPYITPASGLAKFRTPIGNGGWIESPAEIATYGTVAAQGLETVNAGLTVSLAVSGYTTGSLTGIYYYRVCPIGPNGDENPYAPGAAPATANITSGTSGVVLTWTDPTTSYIPVSKWRVYRGSAGQPYTGGTAGQANPFSNAGEGTSVGTSVYFDTASGATSFTDTGAAGTAGFPPAMYRGPEGWLASNRGIYTPGLFTCMTQGNYALARAVNVNGVVFTNASMHGANSNSKIIQSYDMTWNLTNSASYFLVNNTDTSAAGNSIYLVPTSGASYISIYYASNLRTRLAPHILDTTSDSTTASGIAYYFNTNSAITDPRKLMSVQNNSVERFGVSAYGAVTTTIGNATAKGITVKAAASQSANLLEIQNSSSVISTWIDPSGRIGQNIGNSTIPNIAIGSGVAPSLTVGSGNIIIGDEAGKNLNGSSSYNIIINQGSSDPQQTVYSPVSSGYNSIYIGRLVHPQNNFQDNIALGGSTYYAVNGNCNVSGSGMIVLGHWNGVVSGVNSVVIGKDIGTTLATHTNSVIIGQSAGSYSDSSTAASGALLTNNVFIGSAAGQGSSGNYNVGIGSNALGGFIDGTIGNNNIELITSSSYRMDSIFGRTHDNKLNIQRTIAGDSSTNRIFIGAVASGDFAPSSILQVRAKNTTDKVLIAQGIASQSANIFEVQNSSGIAISLIDSVGQISGVALNVASGITLPSGIPTVTTSKLYASGTTLYWGVSPVTGVAAGSNTQIIYNNNGIQAGSSGLTWDGTALSANLLKVTQSATNEGGQIDFSLPSSGSSLSGTIAIDVYQNKLRIFETTGSNRGVYIDFTSASGGVGTNLLSGGGGGGGTTTNALTFASGITFTSSTFNGSTAVTIGLPAATVYTSGSYANPTWITSIASSTLSGVIATGIIPTIPIAQGGTSLTTSPTNGQLLIGSGSSYALNTLTAGSGINITNTSGAITINTSGLVAGVGVSGWIPFFNSTTGIINSSGQSVYIGTVTSPFAAAKTLVIKAASGQSVNIFEAQNFSGSGLFTIDQSGGVNFAPWSGTAISPIKYDGANKRLVFTGSGTGASGINLNVLADSTLSFESTAGQLFSIADGLASGTIFSVNDISGMPSIEVDASGLIKLGEYDGFVGVGTSQTFGQYAAKVEINYPSGNYKGLIIRPSVGGTGNIFETQSSASGTLIVVDASGEVGINSAAPGAMLDITSRGSAIKGAVIKSAASQTANLFEVQNSSSTPILAITPSGAISGAITPTILTSTGNLTLTDIHNGYIIEQTGVAGSGTFTIGSVSIPGWNCMIVNIGSGVIVASGSNTMRSPGGLNKSRTQYSSISIYRRGSNDFVLTGDLV